MATSAVEELRKDHEILRRDLGAIGNTIRGGSQDLNAGQQMLDGKLRREVLYLTAAMGLHFRREEEALFPEAQRMVSEGAEGADVMGRFFGEEADDDINAHAALRGRMHELAEMLAGAEAAGSLDDTLSGRLRAHFALISGLLDRHATKEDDMIFPMIERSLTPEQRDEVLDRLAAIRPLEEELDPRMRQTDGLVDIGASREYED